MRGSTTLSWTERSTSGGTTPEVGRSETRGLPGGRSEGVVGTTGLLGTSQCLFLGF